MRPEDRPLAQVPLFLGDDGLDSIPCCHGGHLADVVEEDDGILLKGRRSPESRFRDVGFAGQLELLVCVAGQSLLSAVPKRDA